MGQTWSHAFAVVMLLGALALFVLLATDPELRRSRKRRRLALLAEGRPQPPLVYPSRRAVADLQVPRRAPLFDQDDEGAPTAEQEQQALTEELAAAGALVRDLSTRLGVKNAQYGEIRMLVGTARKLLSVGDLPGVRMVLASIEEAARRGFMGEE